jgi:hypothetical protein
MVDDESRILGFSINTDGMSLRDYFAAKAMQALLAGGAHPNVHHLAADAYKAADAMLEERDK